MSSRRSCTFAVASWAMAAACQGTTAERVAAPHPPPALEVRARATAPEPLAVRDSDRDRIPDPLDACPTLPGMPSTTITLNGCPPTGYYDDGLASLDRDGDAVLDGIDACPDLPGVAAAEPASNGCPPKASQASAQPGTPEACTSVPSEQAARDAGCPEAWVEGDRIRILGSIGFESGRAALLARSDGVLAAVKRILVEHPEVEGLEIQGHTDDRGAPAMNRALSQKRAESVLEWLARSGVARERLAATGYGFERPIAGNDTEEGRARNRRVEFRIARNRAAPGVDTLEAAARAPTTEAPPLVPPSASAAPPAPPPASAAPPLPPSASAALPPAPDVPPPPAAPDPLGPRR